MNTGHFKRGVLAAAVLQGWVGGPSAMALRVDEIPGAIYVDNTANNGCFTDVKVWSSLPPGCGSFDMPWQNLSGVVNAWMAPGTLIIVAGGGKPYRGHLSPPAANWNNGSTARSVLRGWVGKPRPVVAGSIELPASQWTTWIRNDNVVLYRVSLDMTMGGLSEPNGAREIPSPQQVFVGGTPLTQANVDIPDTDLRNHIVGKIGKGPASATVENMPIDSFLFVRDTSISGFMYLRLSAPLNASVEIASAHFLFVGLDPRLNNITISNMEFKHSNTSAYTGGSALMFCGGGVVLDNIHVHDVDLQGLRVGACAGAASTPTKVTNSVIERAGQLGVGGTGGAGFQFTGNTLRENNTRDFNPEWEAGGAKFVSTPYLKNGNISNNKVLWNNGPGIWFDTYQSGNTVSNNLFAFNHIGLFLELSSNNTVKNNTFVGNYGQGAQLKGTGNVVTGNLLVYNEAEGIFASAFKDPRIINPSQPTWGVINNAFRDNRFVSNGGEFATRDNGQGRQFYVASGNTVERNRYCTTGYTLVGVDSTQNGVPSSQNYGVSNYGSSLLLPFSSWQAAPLRYDAATPSAITAGSITDTGIDLVPLDSTKVLGKLRTLRLSTTPAASTAELLTQVGQLPAEVAKACKW
jgi:parallel beta-helix repeat protein